MICFFINITIFFVFYLDLFIEKKIIKLFENVINNKLDVEIIIICIIFISFFFIKVVFSISISIRVISFAIFVFTKIIALLFVKKKNSISFFSIFFINIFV